MQGIDMLSSIGNKFQKHKTDCRSQVLDKAGSCNSRQKGTTRHTRCTRVYLYTWDADAYHLIAQSASWLQSHLSMKHIFTDHHGISCLSQAKNLPFDSVVVPSMISSSCLTARSFVNSFSGTTFCKQDNSYINHAGCSQLRCRLKQQSSIYCCWRTQFCSCTGQ